MREKLIALAKEGDCSSLTYAECSRCKYGCKGDCSYQFLADHLLANGVVVREKGEWGLEARSFYRDTFDESCELVVYILANCTNCGEKHPNAHQVFSKTLYAPEDAEEDFRFNQSLERMNALREFKAKGYKFAHFCPNCGADMGKGENG